MSKEFGHRTDISITSLTIKKPGKSEVLRKLLLLVNLVENHKSLNIKEG